MPVSQLDFQQAKVNHLRFKSNLRSILYDEATEGEFAVLSQYACKVGQWIYSHALIVYETIPEVHTLEKVHADIHTTARELIALHKQGRVAEARRGLDQIEIIADELMDLLDQIEKKVRTPTPAMNQSTVLAEASELVDTLNNLLQENQQLDAQIKAQSLELTQNNQIFTTLMGASPVVLWMSDAQGAITYVNQTWIDWTGRPFEDHLGGGWAESIIEEDRSRSAEQFLADVAAQRPYIVDFRIQRKDGVIRWCTVAGQPWYSPQGKFSGYAGSCMDITERHLAEQALLEKTENERQVLHDFFMQAPAAHCILRGPEHTFELANAGYVELVGNRNLLGKPVRQALPELQGQGFFELLDQVFTSQQAYVGKEVPVVLKKNQREQNQIYVNFIYQPILNRQGETGGILVFAYEVTEQLLARQRIEESEARFRSLIEEAPVATFLVTGPKMRITVANEPMIAFWGKGKSVLGKPFKEAVPELEGQPFFSLLDDVYNTGTTYTEKAARAELTVGGQLSTFYFDYTYKPLFGGDGQVYGIMCMAHDVTEQVRAQQELAASEVRFRTMVQQAPVAMLVTRGENMVFEIVNQAMLDLLNRDASIIGKPALVNLPELETQPVWQTLNTVYRTGEPYFADELPIQLIRGGELKQGYFTFSYIPLQEDEKTVGVLQVVVDMTMQVEARLKAQESEERYRTLSGELEQQVQVRTGQLQATVQDLKRSNENLQQFAYVASHDLQEPLRKIQQFGDLLRTNYVTELGEGNDLLRRMQDAASRMSTLIRDLLTFSRISTQQEATKPVSLNAVIKATLDDLDLLILETGAQVTVDQLPTLPGDSSQLGQLFQNLLSNALKFRTPDRIPSIRISAHQVSAPALPTVVRPTREAAVYHRIDVTDNGIGFNEKYLDRIFQVFQRLHSRNEYAGTGIGLAICEKVAANHGGAISAHSQPGQGATFSVYFPESAGVSQAGQH